MVLVKICCGTVCHVMGGGNLPLLSDFLSDDLKEKVKIEGTACLGHCNKDKSKKPPFVEVNDKLISEASFPKIIECIKEELNLK